ncbi:hypothetical protein FOZ60_015464 [Perkinsus olseni]|uniref:Uncharacterized protein n=1 Tax=Perkinsus olseni TaxID=32597 RepID=A0A7J6P6U3_PEROL|nr:hypothetical protein FOZ60_015464 [Perkinsus olseni]
MMTIFAASILLIIGLTVAAEDGNVKPKSEKEARSPIMQEGAAMSPYQFDNNFIVTALRGSESHLLPGPAEQVSSDSLKLQDSLCNWCHFCQSVPYWLICWPTLSVCGSDCDNCCS